MVLQSVQIFQGFVCVGPRGRCHRLGRLRCLGGAGLEPWCGQAEDSSTLQEISCLNLRSTNSWNLGQCLTSLKMLATLPTLHTAWPNKFKFHTKRHIWSRSNSFTLNVSYSISFNRDPAHSRASPDHRVYVYDISSEPVHFETPAFWGHTTSWQKTQWSGCSGQIHADQKGGMTLMEFHVTIFI